MGLPIGHKLVKSGSIWAILCGTHISVTTGWIYTIWSSVELPRPVVVQHHGHLSNLDLGFSRSNFENAVSQEWKGRLTWNERDVSRWDVTPTLWLSTFPSLMTLTLDFQGQILKKSYLRNRMADWHGIKGMRVDRMLDPCCDFQCPRHPWHWPCIFKVKFGKCCIKSYQKKYFSRWWRHRWRYRVTSKWAFYIPLPMYHGTVTMPVAVTAYFFFEYQAETTADAVYIDYTWGCFSVSLFV